MLWGKVYLRKSLHLLNDFLLQLKHVLRYKTLRYGH
jgi:hypothetical protein